MDITTAVFVIVFILFTSSFICYRIHKKINKRDDGFPESRDRE